MHQLSRSKQYTHIYNNKAVIENLKWRKAEVVSEDNETKYIYC